MNGWEGEWIHKYMCYNYLFMLWQSDLDLLYVEHAEEVEEKVTPLILRL